MMRSLIGCCLVGFCLALVGCEQPTAQKPEGGAPAAKPAADAEKAATKPGDDKKAGKDKGTRKKKAPHVTTAK